MTVSIDHDLCTACDICAHVCPRHIPVTIENDSGKTTVISTDRIDLCMKCGQCAAICPHGAILVAGMREEDFTPVEALAIDDSQLLTLMKQRRSIRRYKDKPVPREVIDRMIDAAQCAPTGTGHHTTGVIVIDTPVWC